MKIDKVRGHMCMKLKEYQESSTYGCIPSLSEEGYTNGCDDTNYTPILYCPFCGEKLPKPKVYNMKCDECNREWESSSEDWKCIDEDCYGIVKET